MKKTKRFLSLLMICALCAILMAGCGSESDSGGSSASAELTAPVTDINNGDAATIAYIPMGAGQEDYSVILSGMQEALGMYDNVTLLTYDPAFDTTTQINIMNECINQGIDAIICNSLDSTALNSTIAEAEAAGIPVITLNNGASGTHTAHIMNTDYVAGWSTAEYLAGIVDEGANVVILDVNASLKQTCTMGTGFEDYAAETGYFNILEDYAQETTFVEDGYNATSEMLSKYDDIDIIYSVNDNGAIGAYQALAAAGKENDGIIIWGYSGTPAGLDAIAQGQVYGTSYSDPFYEGYAAVVVTLLNIQTGVSAASLNAEFTAQVTLPCKIVTIDNVLDTIATTHWDMSNYDY